MLIAALLLVLIAPARIASAQAAPHDAANAAHESRADSALVLFTQVFRDEDADAAAELIAPGAVLHTPRFGDYAGPQGVLDYVAFVKRIYPDAEYHITTIATRGDTVEVSWIMTATQVVLDPTEGPLDFDTSVNGTLTLVVDGATISDLTLVEGDTLSVTHEEIASAPADAGYNPRSGQPQ
jgi:hypothetical protein